MGLADRDYMRERHRTLYAVPVERPWGVGRVIALLLSVACLGGSLVQRYGIPSPEVPTGPVLEFPGTGDVFLTKYADLRGGQSTFGVTVPASDPNNYVVLLVDATTGHAVMAIYCRSGDATRVPVPIGSYRVRVASGMKWYGISDLFGRGSHVEEVVPTMDASASSGPGIDFDRRIDSKLPIRPIFKSSFSGGV